MDLEIVECRRTRKSRYFRIIPRLLLGYLGTICSSVQWLRGEFEGPGGMYAGIFDRHSEVWYGIPSKRSLGSS